MKLGSVSPSILFFSIVLAILLFILPLHINFKISLSMSTKKKKNTEFFDWVYVESLDQVRKNNILRILSAYP